MVQTPSIFLQNLPVPLAPSGWRVLPTDLANVVAFRGPSGLTVSVADSVEEGEAWRRLVVSRPAFWPTRLDLEFVVRQFLGEGLGYEVRQKHGLGPLAVSIDHRASGGQGTAAAAREQLDQVGLLNEAANVRREQSTMRASMARVQLTTPEGWRKRPSPLGPPVYDQGGFQVIVCEEQREGRRWATISVGRADRKPTLIEAQRVARLFLGEPGLTASPTTPEGDPGARRVLVLECCLG